MRQIDGQMNPKETAWIDAEARKLILPDLRDKNALVTGSSSGIGLATVQGLLANKVNVFGLDLAESGVRNRRLTSIHCDLRDTSSILNAFDKISAETTTLDYVVNVAGMDPKYRIDEIEIEQWNELVDLNLRAYYFVIKHALPLLRNGTGRSIVNVSSINYRLGIPGRAPYSATKAGILGMTTGLSRELGRENIRINAVTPGWVFTERQVVDYFAGKDGMKNLDYLAKQQSVRIKISPADVANHILFYLSSVSRASTGHNCIVDGGWILE